MGTLAIDPNTLFMGAILAFCAYMLRQREARDRHQDSQSILVAALESRFEERFKTIFADVGEIKADLRVIMDKLPARRRGSR